LRLYEEIPWRDFETAKVLTAVAALFHDWGKASDEFQEKLRRRSTEPDSLRHEWVSAALFGTFVSMDPDTWRERLASGDIDEKYILSKVSSFEMEEIGDADSYANTIAWLILSHHKLPTPRKDAVVGRIEDYEDFFYGFDETWGYVNEEKTPEWKFSHGILPKADGTWIKEVKRWGGRLLSLGEYDLTPGREKYLSFMARAALMLGDHHFSSLKKENANGSEPLLANVTREGKASQNLWEHMVGVRRAATEALAILASLGELLPSVTPSPFLRKRTKAEKFRWQNDLSAKAAEAARNNPKGGFICFNMAGTGYGKTLANAKALLSAGSGRFAVCNGLRSLTLQNGADYAEKSGIKREEISVVIGSKEYLRLHSDVLGSESSEEIVEEETVSEYPVESSPLAVEIRGKKERKTLFPPVLVCTVDHMVRITDALKGGKWLVPFMRLLSSDLVIDEVDSFDEEDLPAIARLVHVAGLLGRRVVLSSATMTPGHETGFLRAYLSGYAVYVEATEGAEPGVSLVHAFHGGASLRVLSSLEEGEKACREFRKKVVRSMESEPPRRIGTVADIPETEKRDVETYFRAVWETVKRAHILNRTEYGNVGYSVGLVRFAHIRECASFGRFLSKIDDSEVEARFLVYHSAFPLALRHETERYLDSVLRNRGRFVEDPVVGEHLRSAERSSRDAIFLVVSTPIEEIGRDHDFDWAVVEPSSVSSVAQLAGRVRRHRFEEWRTENLFIMRYNARAWREGDAKGRRYFVEPGFETSVVMETHDLKKIVSPDFAKRPSPLPKITRPETLFPRKKLDHLEHFTVEKAFREKALLYTEGSAHLTGAVQRKTPFRRETRKTIDLFMLKKEGRYLFVLRENGKRAEYDPRRFGVNIVGEMNNLWIRRDLETSSASMADVLSEDPEIGTEKAGALSLGASAFEIESGVFRNARFYSDDLGLFLASE